MMITDDNFKSMDHSEPATQICLTEAHKAVLYLVQRRCPDHPVMRRELLN
jgi:hypothetical protein